MSEVEIRFAQKDDIKSIVDLCKLHAEFEKSSYDPEGKDVKLSDALFRSEPHVYCLVALVNEKIVGYASYMKQFSTWDANQYIYMDCLFLRSEARGMGIGEKLVDRIKTEGLSFACNAIQWQTPNFNTRAMKFYSRIGAISKSKERFSLHIS